MGCGASKSSIDRGPIPVDLTESNMLKLNNSSIACVGLNHEGGISSEKRESVHEWIKTQNDSVLSELPNSTNTRKGSGASNTSLQAVKNRIYTNAFKKVSNNSDEIDISQFGELVAALNWDPSEKNAETLQKALDLGKKKSQKISLQQFLNAANDLPQTPGTPKSNIRKSSFEGSLSGITVISFSELQVMFDSFADPETNLLPRDKLRLLLDKVELQADPNNAQAGLHGDTVSWKNFLEWVRASRLLIISKNAN
eukprot:Nk52_evm33s1671 gene=Nk52_evmTU33s1671